jgi:hypothetical protein
MQKEVRWATREKKIKANAKNRKKASKHQRRGGSKKKTKINRFGQLEDKRRGEKTAVMTSFIKYYEGIDSVAVIGNYLPRQCGIATFTTDLVEGLSVEAPDIYSWAAAMNDRPEGYPYPKKVRFEINQNKLADYSVASQFLNINQTELLDCRQAVA